MAMSQMGFPAFFLFHQAATCTPELWASSENMEEFLETLEVSGKPTEFLHRVL